MNRICIHLIFSAILLVPFIVFSQPANDNCSGAQNLGTLGQPANCGNGVKNGSVTTVSGTTVGATPENPYTVLSGCNMASPANSVWYKFVVPANGFGLNIDITGATFSNPNIALWMGTNCNSLQGVDCIVGSGASANLNVPSGIVPGNTYFIQVTTNSTSASGTFNLSVNSYQDCSDCLNASTLTVTPLPVNGTYLPGQTVNFCFHIDTWTQVSNNWLHGVQLTFGNGWDLTTISTTSPAPFLNVPANYPGCSSACGNWAYYPNGITGGSPSTSWPAGFYFNGEYTGGFFGCTGCGSVSDNNPGNNFGDGYASSGAVVNPAANQWKFCWTVTVKSGCNPGMSLSVDVNTSGDGESGSWSSAGCSGDSPTLFNAIVACCPPNTNGTNVTCNGGTNGSVTASPVGTASPYTYSWNTSPIQNTQTATGLPAGTYVVTIVDVNLCSSSDTVTITQPAGMTLSTSQVNPGCNPNGTATVNPSGGTPGYTYQWSTTPIQNTQTATGLASGTYTVTVTDNTGCTNTASLTLTAGGGAVNVSATGTDITCNGINNGSIDITPAGGTSPYTYLWSNSATTQDVSSLSPNTYTVTVTDNNGCVGTASVTITQPAVLTANATATNASCNGACDGTVSASAGGGTTNYSYSWSGALGNGANKSSVCSGTYTVTVTDSKGCTATANATVSEAGSLSVSTSCSNESLPGASDGSSTSAPSGGTSPYTFQWSNSQTTQNINGLTAGTYTVTVTDANGCTAMNSCVVSTGAGCNLNLIRSTFTGAGCVELASCISSCSMYFYNPQSMTGDNAQSFAQQYGANLVSVQSATENSCLVNNLNSLGLGGIIWIGFNDTQNEGSFVWYDQSPIVYTNWSGGEPNQAGDEDCVQIYPNGQWNDLSCTSGGSSSVIEVNLCPVTTITPTATNVCPGQSVALNTSTLYGSLPYSYSWTSSPAGFTSNSQNPTVNPSVTTTYFVTATDRYGCISESSVTITGSAISSTGSQNNVSCFGGNDGSATIVATAGSSPYSYSWNGSPSTSDSATSLTAGNYSVTVTDGAGCTSTQSFTITEPSTAVDVTLVSQSNISCFGANDGSITVSCSGGVTPYTYQWLMGVSNTSSASNLITGTHGVMVTDANGCTDTMSFLITQPAALSTSASQINASCFAGNDGSASVSASGGTTPYSYSWSNGNTSSTSSGIIAGTYGVTVSDANGCTSTQSYTITQPAAPLSLSPGSANVSCNGGSNGAASVTASGGSTAYSYSWSPNVSSTGNASNLTAGSYSVTVTDSKNCTATQSFTITEPPALSLGLAGVDVQCNNACDGSATATVNGGVTPYDYSWSPSPGSGQGMPGVSSLCAGSYSLNVTDTNNCTVSGSITLTEPSAFSYSTDSANSHCGQSDGSAGITVTGATSPYSYLWDDGKTTATASGIPGGMHCLTVTDAQGCTISACITVIDNAPPTATATATATVCYGDCNGTATVTAMGGTPPANYTYQWSNSQTTATLFSLCAGTYTVTVSDSKNCTATASATVSEPAEVTIQAQEDIIICTAGSALLEATASGGNGSPYTYTWDNTVSSDTQTVSPTVNTCYMVSATDMLGCASLSDTQCVTILPPVTLVDSVSPDTICSGDGSQLFAHPAGGDGSYSYQWVELGGSFSSNISSPTITPQGSNPDVIEYEITVDDGCSPIQKDTVSIRFYENPEAKFSASGTFGCVPYTVTFTSNSTDPAGSLSQCWWDFGNNSPAVNNCTGYTLTYNDTGFYDVQLTVISVNGSNCNDKEVKPQYIQVNPNPTAEFTASPQPTNVQNMNIQFTDQSAGNGSQIDSWRWYFYDNDQTSMVGNSTVQHPAFNFASDTVNTGLFNYFMQDTGDYPVTLIISTQWGCRDTIEKIIHVDGVYYMNIPNAFTPNGDGVNDFFFPEGVGILPDQNFNLYIFDRWGDMIFRTSELFEPWDGKDFNGDLVKQDVYVWKLELENIHGEIKKFIGHVTLLRK